MPMPSRNRLPRSSPPMRGQAVAARGRFVMAVSGGRTPWQMLRALAGEDVPWKDVHVVQVDERVAPAGDPDRNLTHLQESLLEHAPLRPDQIHAMPVESGDLDAAAAQYAAMLQQIAGMPPVLDLVHLGLGPDGHTASLVPGDPVLDVTDADVALTGIYQGRRRMTLTYPILNRSRRILWLVTGSDKVGPLVPPAGRRSVDSGRAGASGPGPVARRSCGGRNYSERIPLGGENMRVGIATDHGGFALKEELVAQLRKAGHEVVDFGANSLNSGDDYPGLRRAARSGRRGGQGGSRRGDLRQRGRCVGLRQQGTWRPRRA